MRPTEIKVNYVCPKHRDQVLFVGWEKSDQDTHIRREPMKYVTTKKNSMFRQKDNCTPRGGNSRTVGARVIRHKKHVITKHRRGRVRGKAGRSLSIRGRYYAKAKPSGRGRPHARFGADLPIPARPQLCPECHKYYYRHECIRTEVKQ